MPVDYYEVGILRHRDTPKATMLRRTWTRDEVLHRMRWLKRENARGAEIFIRPDDTRWTLLDDLNRKAIDQMKREGLQPSVVVETSPRNYQAWVKLEDEPIRKDVATQIAWGAARAYGGDPHSADYRHLGRLAGFTNRKAKHARNGSHPYALLHEHQEKTATIGKRLVARTEKKLREDRIIHRLADEKQSYSPGYSHDKLTYLEMVKNQKRYPRKRDGEIDWSRVDYRVARDMARAGYPRNYISGELVKHSPDLANRKGRNALKYAERTTTKAMESLSMTLKGAGGEPEQDRGWKDMGKEF